MIIQTLHHFQFAEDLLVAALLLHDELFAHRLDCIQRPCVFFAGKVYLLSEATFTDDLNLVKILHAKHRHRAVATLFYSWTTTFPFSSTLLLLVFHLLGKDGDQRHIMLQHLTDSFVAHRQPKIDILILVRARDGANDFLLNLDQFLL